MPRGDLVHTLADVGVADLGLAVWAVGVAEVDDLQPVEDLEPEVEVVGARLVRRGPDRPRPEAGARTVGGRHVERRADDGHVGLPRVELLDVGEERPLAERAQPAEHVAELELLPHPVRQLTARLVARARTALAGQTSCRTGRSGDGSTRRGPKTVSAPGALRPKPTPTRGDPSGTNHPPLVDLPALALARPHIARRARRLGGRCRVIGPVAGCPAPLPSRHQSRCPGKPGTPIRHREDRGPRSQLGWPRTPRPCLPARPPGKPGGRSVRHGRKIRPCHRNRLRLVSRTLLRPTHRR